MVSVIYEISVLVSADFAKSDFFAKLTDFVNYNQPTWRLGRRLLQIAHLYTELAAEIEPGISGFRAQVANN